MFKLFNSNYENNSKENNEIEIEEWMTNNEETIKNKKEETKWKGLTRYRSIDFKKEEQTVFLSDDVTIKYESDVPGPITQQTMKTQYNKYSPECKIEIVSKGSTITYGS